MKLFVASEKESKASNVRDAEQTSHPSSSTEPDQETSEDEGANDPEEEDQMPLIERMLEAAEIDEQGNWTYQGYTSGHSFLQSMKRAMGAFVNDEAEKDIPVSNLPVQRILDAALDGNWGSYVDLPPRYLAEELVSLAMVDACGVMIFTHGPHTLSMLRRIYDTPQNSYGKVERSFLPLLYAAIAVGFVYRTDPIGSPAKEKSLQEG